MRRPIPSTLAEAMTFVGIDTDNVRDKIDEVRKNALQWTERRNAPRFIKEFVATFVRMGTDLDMPLRDLAILVGAVAYVILPFDAMPDFLPLVGWVDDAAVIKLAMKALKPHWEKHQVSPESSVHGIDT